MTLTTCSLSGVPNSACTGQTALTLYSDLASATAAAAATAIAYGDSTFNLNQACGGCADLGTLSSNVDPSWPPNTYNRTWYVRQECAAFSTQACSGTLGYQYSFSPPPPSPPPKPPPVLVAAQVGATNLTSGTSVALGSGQNADSQLIPLAPGQTLSFGTCSQSLGNNNGVTVPTCVSTGQLAATLYTQQFTVIPAANTATISSTCPSNCGFTGYYYNPLSTNLSLFVRLTCQTNAQCNATLAFNIQAANPPPSPPPPSPPPPLPPSPSPPPTALAVLTSPIATVNFNLSLTGFTVATFGFTPAVGNGPPGVNGAALVVLNSVASQLNVPSYLVSFSSLVNVGGSAGRHLLQGGVVATISLAALDSASLATYRAAATALISSPAALFASLTAGLTAAGFPGIQFVVSAPVVANNAMNNIADIQLVCSSYAAACAGTNQLAFLNQVQSATSLINLSATFISLVARTMVTVTSAGTLSAASQAVTLTVLGSISGGGIAVQPGAAQAITQSLSNVATSVVSGSLAAALNGVLSSLTASLSQSLTGDSPPLQLFSPTINITVNACQGTWVGPGNQSVTQVTGVGTWTFTASMPLADILVVGGGGAGGPYVGGGGGGGGVLLYSNIPLSGTYTVVVGAGGVPPSGGTCGGQGGASSFGALTPASGGGYGANGGNWGTGGGGGCPASSGGSGGGGGSGVTWGAGCAAGTTLMPQTVVNGSSLGNGGGTTDGTCSTQNFCASAGGGGAGGRGGSITSLTTTGGGAGGPGALFTLTGGYYGGGGGGAAVQLVAGGGGGAGGLGGGGAGAGYNLIGVVQVAGSTGAPATGGGGGGGGWSNIPSPGIGAGYAGGSGVVVVREHF